MDLQQLFLIDESRVDIYLYPSIQWADAQKLTKAALIVLDVLPVSLEYLFPEPRIREWQTKYKDFALQAKIVITISEWSASEIMEKIGIPKERLHVIPLGIEKKDAVNVKKILRFCMTNILYSLEVMTIIKILILSLTLYVMNLCQGVNW